MPLTKSNFAAATFAPYTPPPDEIPVPSGSTTLRATPWFPPVPGQPTVANSTSYQAGAVPSFQNATGGGIGAVEEQGNVWETRYGWRVDLLAAVAYLGGPVTALILLILETTNDYVRFHAYQSALFITPILVLRIFIAIIGFGSFISILFTLALIGAAIGMAVQAFRDANAGGLARFHIPYIGELAEKWLAEE